MTGIETIGADLGGTNLALCVLGSESGTVWEDQVSSSGYSQEQVIDLLVREVERAREARPSVAGVGLGIPARIDFEEGHAIDIDNDGIVAMMAEALFGAAKGARHALMLTLGTGVGGGIWIDGRTYRGASGAAAELGHTVVEIDGPRCQGNCPGRGCIEAFASGTGIAKLGTRSATDNPDSALGRITATGQEITAREVNEAASAGDSAAIAVVEEVGHYLGTALVSLSNIFEPEVIVLGGGAMAFGDLLLEPVRQEVAARALSPMDATPVVAARLGPAAGMIGAAALARVELEAAR